MTFASRSRSLGVALAALITFAAGPARADVPISPEARAHFKAGVKLLQDPAGPRYEDAYLEFKQAYAASPSARILGNLAICAMNLERDEEAIAAYERFLAEVPDLGPEEREQSKNDLTTLKTGLVRVKVSVNVAGATLVDTRAPVQGAPIVNTYGPIHGSIEIGVRPGKHTILVKAETYEPATWEVEMPPGSQFAREMTLKKPAPPPRHAPPPPAPLETHRPIPTSALVLGAASVALAAGGAVTGVLALRQRSQFDEANDGRDPDRAAGIKSTGEALDVTTDVLFAAALVGAGFTTYLYIARPTVSIPREPAPALGLSASWSPAGPAMVFSGKF